MGPLATILLLAAGITGVVLAMIFIVGPLLKGLGYLITGLFRLIGWTFVHLFEFVSGMLSDAVRFIGAIIAMVVLLPLAPLNVIIGRWSAAAHFADSMKRECQVGIACLYRLALQRPLKLLLLHGLLEGVEQRVPQAMAAAPTSDKPRRRTAAIEGYTIKGSLPGGGSGGKLYVAEPNASRLRDGMPERVVIKAFALSEGSTLPQIVRESRALEAAKQMGLVLDHSMDEQRFYYVMPYHPGDHLGIMTRQMHGESAHDGLGTNRLRETLGYVTDLLTTLSQYHRGGLWHKDVKPENIIVHDGRAHLVDLGLVTPLRSAMTLTTHGTEYFRDPEMVRQALRGVKVHQVDGARFDVYAVGAVLYFMVENTFPAHGGLSRFSKRSPESLRWIIRRSMADYSKRYETSDAMLADLRVVAEARDPFAVKPADLPSMTGAPVQVAAAVPPPLHEDATHADADAPAVAPTPAIASGSRRPKIRVTNWWTGEYVVEDPGQSGSNEADLEHHVREASRQWRHQAQNLRHQVKQGAVSARRAARQQVQDAQRRARDIQNRASRRGGRARGERPSLFLAAVVVLFLLATIVGIVAVAGNAMNRSQWNVAQVDVTGNSEGRPIAVVLDRPRGGSYERGEVNYIMSRYEDDGYLVVRTRKIQRDLRPHVRAWIDSDHSTFADESLENAMERHSLYGVVFVEETDGYGDDYELDPQLIYSTRDGAEQRRFGVRGLMTDAHAPSAPAHPTSLLIDAPETPGDDERVLLIVNDHPLKGDEGVRHDVEAIVNAYRHAGWELVVQDDAEIEVRQVMPMTPLDDGACLPNRMLGALEAHQLDGVLLLVADRDGGSDDVKVIPLIRGQ